MVEHRKTVARKAYVPSSWFIVLTVMLCLGGAGWIGWLLVGPGPDSPVASPSASAPAATGTPTPSATPTTEPTPDEPTPSEEPTPSPSTPTPDEATRDVPVSVLNNSGVAGAARAFSATVTSAGWTVGGVGNWTGSIAANTVYYPPGFQPQAELLAADVDIDRVRPSVAPMRTDRLTIILSGPQS